MLGSRGDGLRFSSGCSQVRHLLYSDRKQVETSRKAHTRSALGKEWPGVTPPPWGGRRAPGILSHNSLSEVVGTLVGDHVPGLVKGFHDSRLQGPSSTKAKFCSSCSRLDMPKMTASPRVPCKGRQPDLSTLSASW